MKRGIDPIVLQLFSFSRPGAMSNRAVICSNPIKLTPIEVSNNRLFFHYGRLSDKLNQN